MQQHASREGDMERTKGNEYSDEEKKEEEEEEEEAEDVLSIESTQGDEK